MPIEHNYKERDLIYTILCISEESKNQLDATAFIYSELYTRITGQNMLP